MSLPWSTVIFLTVAVLYLYRELKREIKAHDETLRELQMTRESYDALKARYEEKTGETFD